MKASKEWLSEVPFMGSLLHPQGLSCYYTFLLFSGSASSELILGKAKRWYIALKSFNHNELTEHPIATKQKPCKNTALQGYNEYSQDIPGCTKERYRADKNRVLCWQTLPLAWRYSYCKLWIQNVILTCTTLAFWRSRTEEYKGIC